MALSAPIAKHNPPEVRKRFARHTANELAMSVITLGDLRFGAEKSQMRERALSSIQKSPRRRSERRRDGGT